MSYELLDYLPLIYSHHESDGLLGLKMTIWNEKFINQNENTKIFYIVIN